jgi:hypothetical protein
VSTKKHVKLAEYIQQHKKNWDLDVKVVMPGKAGKQLFKEYPLSDQSVVARAHGRTGGLAGKGKPKTGRAARGSKKTGGRAKGVPNTGRAAKGAANWRSGVMATEQDFLRAFQQEVLGALKGVAGKNGERRPRGQPAGGPASWWQFRPRTHRLRRLNDIHLVTGGSLGSLASHGRLHGGQQPRAISTHPTFALACRRWRNRASRYRRMLNRALINGWINGRSNGTNPLAVFFFYGPLFSS